LKAARFMGNRHANGNFPPASAARPRIDAATDSAAVKKIRPDIDLLLLERMAQSVAAVANPLAHLPQQQSPNVSLAVISMAV
jgi:CelD/BcsL family acetyltransferase involved in cellulose biosynthesis